MTKQSSDYVTKSSRAGKSNLMKLQKDLGRVLAALRVLDFLVLGLVVVAFAGTTFFAMHFSADAKEVTVKAGEKLYIYRLDKNLEFDVAGPLGLTHIEIKDKAVRVVDSPCRDKICVQMGWLRNGGQWAACLPNRVFLSINSAEKDGIDATTY